MGWFTPKYPTPDTPGATSAPARRESRADRRNRELIEANRQRVDADFERLHAEMADRDRRRAETVERFNRRRGK